MLLAGSMHFAPNPNTSPSEVPCTDLQILHGSGVLASVTHQIRAFRSGKYRLSNSENICIRNMGLFSLVADWSKSWFYPTNTTKLERNLNQSRGHGVAGEGCQRRPVGCRPEHHVSSSAAPVSHVDGPSGATAGAAPLDTWCSGHGQTVR